MDEKRIEEIHKRLEAATPGKWKVAKDRRYIDHDECWIELDDDFKESEVEHDA